MTSIQSLQGVDVSQFNVIKLDKKAFANLDYNLYTPLRSHFAIHAIQFGRKLPSEKSMMRSEKRNQKKSNKQQINKLVGRKAVVPIPRRRVVARTITFVLPRKYGRRVIKRSQRQQRQQRSSRNARLPVFPGVGVPIGFPLIGGAPPLPVGMAVPPLIPGSIPSVLSGSGVLPPTFVNPIPPTLPFGSIPSGILPTGSLPGLSPPSSVPLPSPIKFSLIIERPQNAENLPLQIVPKRVKKISPKQKNKSFKIQSAEQIVLKNARRTCREAMEQWRKESKPIIESQLDEHIPLYFRKKKANQKRRRLQKHQLIKQNRKKLLEIFGNAIYQRGWPVSRREIKLALGILQEQNNQKFEGIADLMEQGDKLETQQEVKDNESSGNKKELKLVLLREEQVEQSTKVQQIAYSQ